MGWVRRARSCERGASILEYILVLGVVGVVAIALTLSSPGVGSSSASAIRRAVCMLFQTGGDCGGDLAGPRDPGDSGDPGEDGPQDGERPEDYVDGEEPGGNWALEFAEGFLAQIWDEIKGIWDTLTWIWNSVFDEETRRANRELWEMFKRDPLGFVWNILQGLWEPIMAEINSGKPAAAVGRTVAMILAAVFGGKGLNKLRQLNPDVDDFLRHMGPDAEDEIRRRAGNPEAPCNANSFLAATPVLLADGTALPIAQVAVGDLVLAADPATGEVGPRAVTHEIVGSGPKRLVDVLVGGLTVTATDGHPFYLPDLRAWVQAEDLRAGDDLLTADGDEVTVGAVRTRSVTTTVHNLTVDDLHTYFVLVGDEPVLVHNQAPCPPGPNTSGPPGYQWGPENGQRRLPNTGPFTDPDVQRGINETLDRIEDGGPFPHPNDGSVFQNDGRNGTARLPARPNNYYYEYTVDTHQGPRRIIVGRQGEVYYTDDHYRTFDRIDPKRYPPPPR
jgi:hypothetical protein